MAKFDKEVLSTIVEKLGVDPCLLAIVIIVIVFFWFMRYTYKHQEKMEQIRVSQWLKAMGKGDVDGSN